MSKAKSLGKKISSNPIVIALMMIVAGIVLILWNGSALDIAVRVIGGLLALSGLTNLISAFIHKNDEKSKPIISIIAAIAFIAIGIVLITNPGFITGIFPFVMGLMMILNSLADLYQVLNLKKDGDERWSILGIAAAVTLVLGIIICVNPFETLNVLLIMNGITMIYGGIIRFVLTFRAKKLEKE